MINSLVDGLINYDRDQALLRIMQLPDETRVFVGHDYLPKDGRSDFAWETTVGEERSNNIHIGGGKSQASVDLKKDLLKAFNTF